MTVDCDSANLVLKGGIWPYLGCMTYLAGSVCISVCGYSLLSGGSLSYDRMAQLVTVVAVSWVANVIAQPVLMPLLGNADAIVGPNELRRDMVSIAWDKLTELTITKNRAGRTVTLTVRAVDGLRMSFGPEYDLDQLVDIVTRCAPRATLRENSWSIHSVIAWRAMWFALALIFLLVAVSLHAVLAVLY